MQRDVVVIGAGAAGIMAAWNAARHGADVLLLEKTVRVGTKILMSGGGKCNITHDGPLEDVLKAFRAAEARFLRPSCYRLPNTEIVRMLTDRGLRVMTRPDGRIFPVDQTAKDVVRILASYVSERSVDLRLQTSVTGVRADGAGLTVDAEGGPFHAKAVVVTTGGSSYPKSGTTGDGWAWAGALGHTVVTVRAALAPMDLEADRLGGGWPFPPGVALRDVVLKARCGTKESARWRDDVLFTHHGVSGPCALGISRDVAERLETGPVTLEIDLLPDSTFEALSERLRKQAADNPQARTASLCPPGVPESLRQLLFATAGVDPDRTLQSASKKELNRVVETLKGWTIGRVTDAVLDKGEAVAGGVALDEVDPKTMRSTKHPCLFLAGEVLDIVGPVGGYNLQAAFATGFVAGESAAATAAGSR
ncbi:MAG: aminoacetone oxidase family FAD-binding enzyme [Armatimonadetes bacterium]|nr:aminoacetone oxidase family FAD-binding enzyme [Armatimonadota bacterium]